MATRVGQVGFYSLSTIMIGIYVICTVLISAFGANDWNAVPRSDQLQTSGLNLKDLGDGDSLTKLFASDGYFTDTRQDEVKPFNGISIQNEAQKLSANLRWLSNEEIGVTTMQVKKKPRHIFI